MENSFKNIRILSYNINGLKNKILFQDFFDFIKTYDIFCLIETHIEEKDFDNYKKYFMGFEVFFKKATRLSQYGRASGGEIIGVKKDLRNAGIRYNFEYLSDLNIINLKTNTLDLKILPLYFNCNNWVRDFQNLTSYCNENDTTNLVILGDLNIRIGSVQQNIEEMFAEEFQAGMSIRQSKEKVLNSKGKQFIDLCNDFGQIVLNGRTVGDEEGNFTCVRENGSSVNDICAIFQELLAYVNSFTIEDKIWSDHMPLTLVLKVQSDARSQSTRKLPLPLKWKEADRVQYNDKLKDNMRTILQNKTCLDIDDIKEIILASAPSQNSKKIINKKSPWYDYSCFYAKKKSKRFLKRYRKYGNEINKNRYLEAQKKYKLVCEQSRNAYYRNLETKINEIKDSKQWWGLVRELRNKTHIEEVKIPVQEFRQYFEELLNPPQLANDISYAANFVEIEELDRPISVDEILVALKKAKDGRAAGLDRIPCEFYKNSNMEFLNEITKLFNKLYDNQIIDPSFETSIVFPIYKKGDSSIVSNYRGVSFMNAIAKLLMSVLNERLSRWVENNKIMSEFQAGFRKNFSTVDNLYNLAAIVHLKFNEKKKVYALFVDLKAAFDKIPRKLLMFKLRSLGLSSKFVNFVEEMYKSTASVVWNGSELSERFNTLSGVKQGCILSPLLFTLYLNDIHEHIGGGLQIDDININVLLYADDLVILADDIEVLQEMINKFEAYCDQWNLEVNLDKSAIMVFRSGGRLSRKEKWTYKGEEIRIVSEYTYLGVVLTPKMVFTKHLEQRNISAKASINATWRTYFGNDKISVAAKWKMFGAVSRAVQAYASQIWGMEYFEEVDKLQIYFFKRIYRLPVCTPTYGIMLESGMENGHLYTLKLHLNYIYKTLFVYDRDRLPRQLSKKILERKIFWAEKVNALGVEANLVWNETTTSHEWRNNADLLVSHLKVTNKTKMWQKAISSASRFYKHLDHFTGYQYFNADFSRSKVMWIFKARCDVIFLEGMFSRNCTLCNRNELENIQHFLGRCPILKTIRRNCFEREFLSEEEIVDVLNGVNDSEWSKLEKYITCAIKYRRLIMNEFDVF